MEDNQAVSGAKFYSSLKQVVNLNEELSDSEKREIIEMVMDEEL